MDHQSGIQVSIIVPTYNEARNINELLDRVHASLQNFSHEIIVVDDDSPDKTWEIVEKRCLKDGWLRIIRRKEDKGLSKAVLEGFNNARGRIMGVMDADLQHDEGILPDMVRNIKNTPIVIGSRYVKGGGVGDWSRVRRFKSWLATQISALFLNVSVHDPMSGYFLITKDLYEKIKHRISPQGFKILLEILYFSSSEAVEVPYNFRTRAAGESKLTSKVALEYLAQVFRLRMSSPLPRGFIKYCIVGFSGVFVDMFIFIICFKKIEFPVELSGAIATQVAIITNFILNDIWTFSTRRQASSFYKRFTKFEVSCLIGLLIKIVAISIVVRGIGINPILGNGFGIALAIFSNFTLSKLWAWKN